ncbi:hypothetical protein [Paenibacillus hexagrammi]|uniref:Uncharacterized protein n=1 Tax=Paenibacillus hexagrammi TaxID=2908839 RepID=A0ABY3SCQ8_9BACL|nr:hypothetical protein [Paenibacillus sp. YPD9-1]UJF31784.1 hypothetical protein L0M14_18655 [Paenibacillus sp. YPD9-1]
MYSGLKESLPTKWFHTANIVLMVVLMIMMLYPFWHILMYSLSDPKFASTGGVLPVAKASYLDDLYNRPRESIHCDGL